MSAGRIVYIMGPSGAGKDSLIAFARQRIGDQVLFAHRYITRPSGGGEDHVELTRAEFRRRAALGLFALDWESHGLCYGIGLEIDAWMARGGVTVVNGSRNHLQAALQRYPDMAVVHVHAAPDVLAARLSARGRESENEIRNRLARQVQWSAPAGVAVTTIDNSGSLDQAGRTLVETLAGLVAG
jgi:ribose 1,5-bisphosphokinase